MPKPSIYKQIAAVQVPPGPFMKPSPRHWNPGLIRYKGRLWLSVRYHLEPIHGSRCATSLVPIDKKTFQPTALAQHLNLPAIIGDEHFEDARLFMFKGEPHISYTQMTGYRPGVDYSCVMKYARLKLLGNRWLIEEVFWPKYGRNGGTSKEKNWAFFEHAGELHCIYQDHPTRRIIKLKGSEVVAEYESELPVWHWGNIRGGAPPVPFGEKEMLTIFHSSLPTEEAPHFVRYYQAAYVFENKPPFKITAISSRPIAAGSEADGHGYDPRYVAGWKPFVVFPCGCVPDGDDWIISMGVNDWQCAVGRINASHLRLISPDGSDAPKRFFTTPNGSLAVKMVAADGQPRWINWDIPVADRRGAMAPPGYFSTANGREAEAMEEAARVEEITEEIYNRSVRVLV